MGRKALYRFTAKDDELIIVRAKQGYYDRLIAAELGAPINSVMYRRQQLGLFKSGKKAAVAPAEGAFAELEAAYAAFERAAAAFMRKIRQHEQT